jgi:hypothetical protein
VAGAEGGSAPRFAPPGIFADKKRQQKGKRLIGKSGIRMVQTPAARPLSATIPRGRNWMKMMMNRIM